MAVSITPHLWYAEKALEAARFYASIIPDSRGGATEQCGWLRDRYGVCWQVVPRRLGELMAGADRARAARVATAMLGMVKLDIAALEAA